MPAACLPAWLLLSSAQALKQQASEHVRRIRELEARNTHLHRSLASRESNRSTPRSARRPSSGGEEATDDNHSNTCSATSSTRRSPGMLPLSWSVVLVFRR